MDQPTDPLARQLALTALTTEHFNLQTGRMGTIAEANGRSALYLGALSSAAIAIAFVGQANQLGDTFYLFALTLLPPVFLLGVFTYLRLVQTSIEDMLYTMGSFRIRQYFVGLDPAAAAVLPADRPAGDHQAGAHGRGADRPAADVADGGEHGRLHQRHRGRGGRGPGATHAAGGVGPGGRGSRRGGGAGGRDPVRCLPGPAFSAGRGRGAGAVRGPEPEHARVGRARGTAGSIARRQMSTPAAPPSARCRKPSMPGGRVSGVAQGRCSMRCYGR